MKSLMHALKNQFSLLAIPLFWLSYQFPIWIFNFIAPQYPQGLKIYIYLNKVAGDVFEIDVINHYIGMSKLSEAAGLERQFGHYFVIFFAVSALLLNIFPNSKLIRIFSIPAIVFPTAFLAVFYLWLYRLGHELNPAAPVHLPPFTPSIIGDGVVGNFRSFAYPGPSFYIISLSSILLIIKNWMISKKNHKLDNKFGVQ